jgi:uncharacterized protein (UPF0548 family)
LFLLGEPSEARISGFLLSQRDAPLSYAEVGASKTGASELDGCAVDHNRARLGEGEETLERAAGALRAWRMFDVGWIDIFPPDAPIEAGTTVAVLARYYGLLWLNACRIVYLIDEDDGSVHYDLYAFSRPNHLLAKIGYPLSRRLQSRFARGSLQAMVRAAAPD